MPAFSAKRCEKLDLGRGYKFQTPDLDRQFLITDSASCFGQSPTFSCNYMLQKEVSYVCYSHQFFSKLVIKLKHSKCWIFQLFIARTKLFNASNNSIITASCKCKFYVLTLINDQRNEFDIDSFNQSHLIHDSQEIHKLLESLSSFQLCSCTASR